MPVYSETVLLGNLYDGMGLSAASTDASRLREHFDNFYVDMFIGLAEYGQIVDYMVSSNLCDHLRGNVYVKYADEDSAERAVKALNNRFYGCKPIIDAVLSPVTDFGNACCKQNETGRCDHGAYCNFLHVAIPSNDLKSRLFNSQALTMRKKEEEKQKEREKDGPDDKHRSSRHSKRDRDARSRSPRRRTRSRSRSRGRDPRSKHDRSERSERRHRHTREEEGRESPQQEHRSKRFKHANKGTEA